MSVTKKIILNGEERTIDVLPGKRLIDVLRGELGLTGTKEGCGEGECGACSVLVNEEVVNSCLVLFGQLDDGDKVLTVEGLGDEKHLSPIQECIITEGGTQCGICTPGMMMAAHALLLKNKNPTRDEIAAAIAGNLCRCTGYKKIIDAIEKATTRPGANGPNPLILQNTSCCGTKGKGHRLQSSQASDGVKNQGVRSICPGTYEKPKSVPEAIGLFEMNGGRLPILAGGTDLVVQLKSGLISPEGFIDISGLDELKIIVETEKGIEIGALVTHSQLVASSIVKKHAPVLAEAAATIGAAQIQNRGTIGGNIMNASPAGDLLPVLAAYDAEILVQDLTGSRWIAMRNFYKGYRKTALEKNEMLTKIKFAGWSKDEVHRFYKVGTRRAQAISKVVMCVRAKVLHGGIENISIAIGSVAPTVIRAYGTEALLKGKAIFAPLIAQARRSLEDEVHPIDDVRSTADYRRFVCGSLIARFLSEVS